MPAPLLINGFAIDPGLLEARPMRRCEVAECQAHCCGGGVYISTTQVADVLAHAALIQPHLPPERRDPALWFDNVIEPDHDHPAGGDTMGTQVLEDPTHPSGTCCIFLRPDRLCALQAAGLAAGEHPWRFKPFYCALHPLGFEQHVLLLVEDNEMYVEGGSCNRPDPTRTVPLYQLFDVEVQLVVGAEGYRALGEMAGKQNTGRVTHFPH